MEFGLIENKAGLIRASLTFTLWVTSPVHVISISFTFSDIFAFKGKSLIAHKMAFTFVKISTFRIYKLPI